MFIALQLAQFVDRLQMATIPDDVLDKAKLCLFYGYGVAMSSCRTSYTTTACQASGPTFPSGTPGGATLLALGKTTGLAGAVFANCALFHARSQEDTCGASHFGAIVIPLLTGLIEAEGYPLESLLPALIAGYEVGAAVQQRCGVMTTAAGFRASSLFGPVAAAAAVGKLMHLSVDRLAAAISHAVSFSGGPMQSLAEGSDEWRYQLGFAAQGGLWAAELARAGSHASAAAFEGPFGFARVYGRMDWPGDRLVSLGTDWAMQRVIFKPFPACGAAQGPVLVALTVRRELALEKVAAVEVRMSAPAAAYPGIASAGPFTSASSAQSSVPFCVAAALVHGTIDLQILNDRDDPRLLTLLPKISVRGDPQLGLFDSTIEVTLAGGEKMIHERRPTASDARYDYARVASLLERAGRDEQVPPQAFERLRRFVEDLPAGKIGDLLACFESQWTSS